MSLSDNQVIETMVPDADFKVKLVDGLIRVYKGALLNYEAGNIGYAKLGSDTHSEEFVGIALEEKNLAAADNLTNGANEVLIMPKGCGKLVKLTITSTITVANEGDSVYVDGDDAVDLVAGVVNNTLGLVGVIKKYISANQAWVKLT